jgi:hypothetical protein
VGLGASVNDPGRRFEVERGPSSPGIVDERNSECPRPGSPGVEVEAVDMQMTLAYRGHSTLASTPAGLAVALAPNLRRDRVAYEGVLRDPLRFREAIGALHDVVVSDLRHRPRDRSAYQAYLAEQQKRENELRRGAAKQAKAAILEGMGELPEPISRDFEQRYRRLRRLYWTTRLTYSAHLMVHDLQLWRQLVPCDPVITVAPDCLFFECFSADESSYGCLTVDRSAFDRESNVALGTTNVDYSPALYEHFQAMRSYRETRFLVDPGGFEVKNESAADYREEKIDLPASWLRGFLQIQAATTFPARRVPVGREGLYNIIAFLRRHRAKRSPRAVRFELEPGRPPWAVLEPWEERIRLSDAPYGGPRAETIRTWGRDRMTLLARLLPIMDRAEVYLLGTGLPGFWNVSMGPMRLLLGLSGWTANDWTRASALDQLAPPVEPQPATMAAIAGAFRAEPELSFDRLRLATSAPPAELAAGLNRLAALGQLIHDMPAGLYRWRQIMPVTLSAELLGPEHPETEAARRLVGEGRLRVKRDERRPDGLRILEGGVLGSEFSLLLDADGRILRGRCSCSFFYTGGLRRGPCRHLQALRTAADASIATPTSLASWFEAHWN